VGVERVSAKVSLADGLYQQGACGYEIPRPAGENAGLRDDSVEQMTPQPGGRGRKRLICPQG
jgi:hypothetical protein